MVQQKQEPQEPYDYLLRVRKRYRINIATSTKGVKTYDCTVDIEGVSMDEVIAESDKLVALLDARYPPEMK